MEQKQVTQRRFRVVRVEGLARELIADGPAFKLQRASRIERITLIDIRQRAAP
jgi:hypothetical protein